MLQERLLETAIDKFGRNGFDGVSTRDIAKACDTAMSSITYHFGGKEGLYLACADHIAARIRERHAPGMELMRDIDGISREESIRRCLAICNEFVAMMLHPDSENWARFIVREQQSPTAAFERLYQGAMKGLIEGYQSLLAYARADLTERERRAQTMLLFGQALVLRAGRASVVRALGVDALGDDEAELMKAQIRANAIAILTRESA